MNYLNNIIIINNKKKNYKSFNLRHNIIYKKEKIKKIIIQDRIIKLDFDIKNLFCRMCNSDECYHTDYIYNIIYNIDFNLLQLIYCKGFSYDFKNLKKETFYEYCDKYLDDNECCYCLDTLKKKSNLWLCSNCKNLFHHDCISEWIDKKNECPLCKTIINKIFSI